MVSCWFHASHFVFSHFSVLYKKHQFPCLSLRTDTATQPWYFCLCSSKTNGMIHVFALLRFTRYSGEIGGQTHFPCQKKIKNNLIISQHGAGTAPFPVMDYDQFDEDVCQHNTLSDGVSNWMGTHEKSDIMFCHSTVFAYGSILSSRRGRETMPTNEKLHISVNHIPFVC